VGRRADLKTGYDCNSNCLFCVIGDKLFTGDRTTAECVRELEQSRGTCEDVVFTGAEVTIRRDFFVLVRAAKTLGYRNIQIQTNGRMLAYRRFCEQAIEAGANEFSPSIHGPTAKIHDGLTRARGSFEQIVAAIEHLVALRQRVVTNTVIARQNARHLPELARMLVDLGVAQFQLAFPHPTGHAATYFEQVVPRMAEVRPFVHAALRIGIEAGVACMAEAMPYCQMVGLERYVAEVHIPPTEIVYDGYVVPDYGADRMQRGKVRFEQCASCRYEPICEGPWREYPERVGNEEFQPVAGAKIVDTAVVLDPRFEMLGAAAPEVVERETPWLAVAFYPEDGSPACTAQMCGLQAALAVLRDRGVALVGVSPDGPASHQRFAAAHGLAFPLLADPDRVLHRALRAEGRSTYLVDAGGLIAHVLVDVDVHSHAAQVLAAIDRLQAGPRPLAPASDLVVLRRSAG
jgi:MoaA/NifB/PqqE/SkfB family radical SAM enzyme/peroxiredoxin